MGATACPARTRSGRTVRAAYSYHGTFHAQVVGGAVAVALLLQLTGPSSAVLHTSNVGDSRAVLSRAGKAARLSRDFKPRGR